MQSVVVFLVGATALAQNAPDHPSAVISRGKPSLPAPSSPATWAHPRRPDRGVPAPQNRGQGLLRRHQNTEFVPHRHAAG